MENLEWHVYRYLLSAILDVAYGYDYQYLSDSLWDKESDKIWKQNKPCAICEKLGYKDRFVNKIMSWGDHLKGITGITKPESIIHLKIKVHNICEIFPFFMVKNNYFKEGW